MTKLYETRQPATYDDLCAVPENLVAEIVGGELYTSPRPGPRHADASSGLGAALRRAFRRARARSHTALGAATGGDAVEELLG